jgi:hypothetical protein
MLDRLFHAGDPTFAGWLNTVLYFVLSAKSYLHFKRVDKDKVKDRFWLVLLVLFLCLGLNKQLDLHSDLIKAIKYYVISIGYVQYKYPLKLIVVFLGSLSLLMLAVVVKKYLSTAIPRYKLMTLGLVMLFLFVFSRVVAFDHVFKGNTQSWVEYYTTFVEFPSLMLILIGMFHGSEKLH